MIVLYIKLFSKFLSNCETLNFLFEPPFKLDVCSLSLLKTKLFMFSERKNLKLLELLQIRVAYSPIIAVHLPWLFSRCFDYLLSYCVAVLVRQNSFYSRRNFWLITHLPVTAEMTVVSVGSEMSWRQQHFSQQIKSLPWETNRKWWCFAFIQNH